MTKAPSMDIAIIGAGFSGNLTAVNLLLNSKSKEIPCSITIINGAESFYRGLAYSNWDDNLLLNVPAGNMSAFVDRPSHFTEYCQKLDPSLNEGSFVSRRIYGDYLEDIIKDAQDFSGIKINRIDNQVTSIKKDHGLDKLELSLLSGEKLYSDKIVLAIGHSIPKSPSIFKDLAGDPRYLPNPWNFSALDNLPKNLPVLLIGSGLTAIDTAFRLTSVSKRKVILFSRKGLLPQGHRSSPKRPSANVFPEYLGQPELKIRETVRALRNEIEKRTLSGDDWRDVINELRPYTPEIWRRFSTEEKQKFLNKVCGYWDIHRHRIAPVAFKRLEKLFATKQLNQQSGRLEQIVATKEAINIQLRNKQNEILSLDIGSIVNCTGPNNDISVLTDPLIQQLYKDGLISQDANKIGIEVNDHYEVIGSDGKSVSNLFYIGPMLKAKYWEAIAVPELRQHTQNVALELLLK